MKKFGLISLLIIALLSTTVVSVPAAVTTTTQKMGDATWTEEDITGAKRYDTAVSVAQAFVEERGSVPSRVIMAYGGDYPDALAASSLAGVFRCPILLVKHDAIPAGVKTLLRDEWQGAVREFYFVGGSFDEAVITEQLTECSSEAPAIDFASFAGSNRYVTAELVANYVINSVGVTECAVVTGWSSADALSMSSWSYEYKIPILLTKADGSLRGTTKELIDKMRSRDYFKRVYILGGTGVIPEATEVSLAPEAYRLSGNKRYDTSLNVARYFLEYKSYKTDNFRNAVLAVGTDDSYADALVGGPLAGEQDAPLLLVRPTGLAGTARDLIKSNIPAVNNYKLTLVGKAAGTEEMRQAIINSINND